MGIVCGNSWYFFHWKKFSAQHLTCEQTTVKNKLKVFIKKGTQWQTSLLCLNRRLGWKLMNQYRKQTAMWRMASKGNNSAAWSAMPTTEISLVSTEDGFHLAPPSQEIQKFHSWALDGAQNCPTGVNGSLSHSIFSRHSMKTIFCWCFDLWSLDSLAQQQKKACICITQAPHASATLVIFHHSKFALGHQGPSYSSTQSQPEVSPAPHTSWFKQRKPFWLTTGLDQINAEQKDRKKMWNVKIQV